MPPQPLPDCSYPKCGKPRAVLVIDGKRKLSKRCRTHLPDRYHSYLEPITKCGGINQIGLPCKSNVVRAGREVAGVIMSGDYCMAHEPALLESDESNRFGGPQPNSGRPRIPRKTELVMKAIEEAAADVVAELIATALSAEKPVVVGNGMHAYIEHEPDLALRAAVGRDLLDRLLGKARQTTEIIGGDPRADQVKRVPDSPERARKVAEILAASTAVKPDKGHTTGRRRAAPPEPASKPEEAREP